MGELVELLAGGDVPWSEAPCGCRARWTAGDVEVEACVVHEVEVRRKVVKMARRLGVELPEAPA